MPQWVNPLLIWLTLQVIYFSCRQFYVSLFSFLLLSYQSYLLKIQIYDCVLNTYMHWKLLQKTAFCRLFGCSFVCHQAENGPIHKKMALDCPLVMTSIVETIFKTRPDQERGIIVRFKFCRNGDVLRNNCLFKFCQNGDVWLRFWSWCKVEILKMFDQD